jgi:hypothetical protein
MLLDRLFGGSSPECGPSGDAAAEPSAIDYVEWLPGHMLRASQTTLTIATDQALPADDNSAAGDPANTPDPEAVINRLKLVSGLNPVRCAQPTAGRFERARGRFKLAFETVFHETPGRATCTIRMRVRQN